MCPGVASLVDGGGEDGDLTSGVAAERSSAVGDTAQGDMSGCAGLGDDGEPGGGGSPGDTAGDPAMTGKVGQADPSEAGDAAGDSVRPAVAPAGEADETASGGVACTSIMPADVGAATGS